MLYPTWLSSYTHLLREDVRPVSLLNVIGADRAARFSTKPVVSPPQPPPQPAGSLSSVSAMGSVGSAGSVSTASTTSVKPAATTTVKAVTAATAKPSKPITVSDKHSKAGSRTALTEP